MTSSTITSDKNRYLKLKLYNYIHIKTKYHTVHKKTYVDCESLTDSV